MFNRCVLFLFVFFCVVFMLLGCLFNRFVFRDVNVMYVNM